jgi:hypothetical protein
VIIENGEPDDSYSVAMTATAATQNGSVSDPEHSSGATIASTSATAAAGPSPTPGSSKPFTTFCYSELFGMTENAGLAKTLSQGGFCYSINALNDSSLTTSGDIVSSDFSFFDTTDAVGFYFFLPMDFSPSLEQGQINSFEFTFSSSAVLTTVGVCEPSSLTLLGASFVGLGLLRGRKINLIGGRRLHLLPRFCADITEQVG